MGKLISSNLARMKKDIWFLFGVISMFAFGIYRTLSLYSDNVRYGDENTPDNAFGGYIIPVCILCAMICCFFCGEEYNGGTIRNKISVGHSRNKIYTAQLLSCLAAGISMCFAYLIPQTVISLITLGSFQKSADELLAYLLSGILLVAACVSLYCLLITAVQKLNAGMVLTIFIILLIIYVCIIIMGQLSLPAQYMTYPYNPETELREAILLDNPSYPTGAYRKFLEFMCDFLPSGQAYQISYMTSENLPRLMISSVIICGLSILFGLRIFRRKDLK